MNTIPNWIGPLSSFSIFIPIAISIFRYKTYDASLRWLSKLLYITSLIEVTAVILGKYGIVNLPLLHLYTPIEFALLSLVFYYHFDGDSLLRQVIKILIIAFSIFAVYNSFYLQSIYTFNTYARTLSSILLIIYVFCYFYSIMAQLQVKYLEKEPMFWISVGILIYCSANLFLFIYSNIILDKENLLYVMWISHAIFNILKNITYAIALWIHPKNLA